MEELFVNVNEKLSVEIFEDYAENVETAPERRLMSAVLERAILDLNSEKDDLHKEAYRWFCAPLVSSEQELEMFSFEHICMELDFDVKTLRNRIFSERLALRRPRTSSI